MHRAVDAAVAQGVFELLGEEALVADLRERSVEDAVAGGGELDDRHLEAGVGGAQQGSDRLGLHEGERA